MLTFFSMIGTASVLIIAVFILLGFFIYFLPSIIAFRRKKKNALAIFILNLFLGVTFFGWVIAMIWAVMYEEKDGNQKEQGAPSL